MQFQLPDNHATASLKQKWQMFPDVFTYDFSQEGYQKHWESLKDSRYWIVDGMLPIAMSDTEYCGKYNHCEFQKVRIAAMKLLYFGYLNSFNADLDITNIRFYHVFQGLGFDQTYLHDCKKPRSNNNSSSLQARLIQQYNTLSLANLPSNYYFGSAYARQNNFENLARLDPQAIYRFRDKSWPTDMASVSKLCDAALKGSTFECFLKMLYHTFFIQRIFKNDPNLRLEQFLTYINDIPPKAVFRYLERCFFDASYLSFFSSQDMQYYMRVCLLPYCTQLMSVEANAHELIRLMWEPLQHSTRVIPLLFKHEILIDIIRLDPAMTDFYINSLSHQLTPKQRTRIGCFIDYFSQKNEPPYAAEAKKIMDVIYALDPLAERSHEKVAAYCLKMHVFKKEFNAAETIYNCWTNQNKTEDELNAIFGEETVAFYQKQHAAAHDVDGYVDVEIGRASSEFVPVSTSSKITPGYLSYTFFSQGDASDAKVSVFAPDFGSADHV